MNPESICWKSIPNRIDGFHAHPCNRAHAKTQTADRTDYADRADHVERALFAREFRLLQLARHWQNHSWPITQSTSILTWLKFPTSYVSVFNSDSKTLFFSKVRANLHVLEKLEPAILFCYVTRARNNLVINLAIWCPKECSSLAWSMSMQIWRDKKKFFI